VNSTATIHDAMSARPTIQKMPPAYSPALDLAKPTGRNPAAVTSVPVSIGNAVEVQAKVAARARSQPCSITAIPATLISPARDSCLTSREAIQPPDLVGEVFIGGSNKATVLRAVTENYLRRSGATFLSRNT
jgi:hypothetical protein